MTLPWLARSMVCLGCWLPWPLLAATGATFQVSASIVPGCLVVGGVTQYGNLNFGTYSALSTQVVKVALSSGVTVQCTPGVALSMSVDGGLHNSGGRNVQLNGGTARVAYQLFQDAAYSQSLGIAQSVNVPYLSTNANAITLPIYGYMQLPGNRFGGIYSDVVQVQLSF